jgi:DNA-directed RNA polymerase subunit RPC12/RpoP
MDEKPRRPTLHLKFNPAGSPSAPAAPKPKEYEWKCKPCGQAVEIASELADEDYVRCPTCNARLGLARDFRSDPPELTKVRARAVEKKPPAPTPSSMGRTVTFERTRRRPLQPR